MKITKKRLEKNKLKILGSIQKEENYELRLEGNNRSNWIEEKSKELLAHPP